MVTLQEVEQREKELQEVEIEAKQYVREPIPQRRFGVGVTKGQQQAVISRRLQAQSNIQQVRQQKESLKQTRADIKTYSTQQAQLSQLKAKEQQYQYGYNLGLRGVVDPSFSKTAKEGFRTARGQLEVSTQRVQRVEQIRKLSAEGIKPILGPSGQIVGIEDKIRGQSMAVTNKTIQGLPQKDIERYQRAGIIKVSQQQGTPQLTPKEKLNLIVISQVASRKQSIAPKEYFFEKVQRNIEKPFVRLSQRRERKLGERIDYYDPKIYQQYPEANLQRMELIKERKLKSPETIRKAGGFVSFPFYGVGQVEKYVRNKDFREEYQRQTNIQKTKGYAVSVLSLVSLGSIGRSAYRSAIKPIKIYETPVIPTKFYSQSLLRNIHIGSKVKSVGAFEVTAVNLPRQALYVPRYSKVLSGIRKGDPRLLKYNIEQLKFKIPDSKIVEIAPLRVTKSISEPFLIKGGRIQNALGRQGPPSVLTGRVSYYKTGKTRFTSRKLSSLHGDTYGSKAVKTLDRKQLDPIHLKALERIEETSVKGVSALPKDLKLQFSAIETKDLFKIQSRGLKQPKPGKSITRGEITSIQKELLTIQKGTSKYGLKETQVLGERLGVVDVTKPRLRPPKKVTRIEGKTTIKEYELPDLTPSSVKVQAPGFQKTKLKFDTELSQKAIQKAVGTTAINQPKPPTSKLISTAPQVKSTQVSASPFAGTGLYERTSMEAQRLPGVQKFVQAPGLTPAIKTDISFKSVQIPKAMSIPKTITRTMTRQVPKEISLSLPRSITRLTPKTITKQTPRVVPKTITRQVPKVIPKLAPGMTPIKFTPTSSVPPPFVFPKFPSGKVSQPKGVPGYKPFVIRGGQKQYLGVALPKGQALRKAERKALGTLRATFGVEKTKSFVLNGGKGYTPSKDLFRDYRIVKGKKVPLQDTFIQKRGKRLVSGGEIKEIQTARFKI